MKAAVPGHEMEAEITTHCRGKQNGKKKLRERMIEWHQRRAIKLSWSEVRESLSWSEEKCVYAYLGVCLEDPWYIISKSNQLCYYVTRSKDNTFTQHTPYRLCSSLFKQFLLLRCDNTPGGNLLPTISGPQQKTQEEKKTSNMWSWCLAASYVQPLFSFCLLIFLVIFCHCWAEVTSVKLHALWLLSPHVDCCKKYSVVKLK